jgi:CheY-like chemotaxis protein
VDDTALRILVVDNHRDSADSLTILLKLWGHDAMQAYDGETAIAIVPGFDPDIVVIEIRMPQMDGYELARRLSSQSRRSPMHIIAVTVYGQAQDVRRAYEAGFDCHLLKPVEETTLKAVLARYGQRREHQMRLFAD